MTDLDRLRDVARDAIAGAVAGCDHPDAGAPIYDPVRACAECSAAAVVALFRGPVLQVDFAEKKGVRG